jgi:hypothetical protein
MKRVFLAVSTLSVKFWHNIQYVRGKRKKYSTRLGSRAQVSHNILYEKNISEPLFTSVH